MIFNSKLKISNETLSKRKIGKILISKRKNSKEKFIFASWYFKLLASLETFRSRTLP